MEHYERKTGFSDLLKYSFEVVKKNWLTYLVITLINFLPTLIFFVTSRTTMLTSLAALNAMGTNIESGVDPTYIFSTLGQIVKMAMPVLILQIILTPAIMTATYRVARAQAEEAPIELGKALQLGLSSWLKIFLAGIVTFLIGLIPAALIGILVFIAGFLAAKMGVAVGVIMGIAAFVGSIAILIVYAVKMKFVYPILCSEDIGLGEAIRKSFAVSNNGRFWDVFLNIFLAFLVAAGINLGVSVTLGLIPFVGFLFKSIAELGATLLINTFVLIYYMDRESLFPEAESEEIQF